MDDKPGKIRIGNLPVIQGLPVYLAVEKGYFRDAGLDVEIVRFDSPNQLVDSLMQGRIDFGSTSIASGITAIAEYKNPGKLRIYALTGGSKDNPTENIIVPLDSELTSISGLKGKRFGILGGTIQWRTIARHLLAENGLDMDKDVTIVELAPSLQVPALASRQIDALLAIEPMSTLALEKGVGKIIVRGPLETIVSDPFYPGAGVLNVEFAKKFPDVTSKMIEVINKAILEINADPQAAKQYLKGYTPLEDSTIYSSPVPLMKSCESLTDQDREALQRFYDLFSRYKVVDGDLPVEPLLYC